MASEAFAFYFDDDVPDMLVLETNRYAHQMNKPGCYDHSKDEVKAFFGIPLLMSVNPSHHFYLYWSSDLFFNVPEISKLMTFKRFQSVLNCLHVSDNSKQEKKGKEDHDHLAKIRPLITALNVRFAQHYTPSAHQVVDENMIPFKGRSSLKEYLPMKPIKRGYRVWCRADSDPGYLMQFQVYEGSDASWPAERALGEHVGLSLAENIQHGAQLYFDNYFTTTRLMKNLTEKGVLAAGTLRSNRKDLPPEIKAKKKLKKGEHMWRLKGAVTAYQWKDNKHVHAMFNFHSPVEVVEVNRKLSSGAIVSVTCPKVISDYNAWMGGVNRFDQKRKAYPADHRSKNGGTRSSITSLMQLW